MARRALEYFRESPGVEIQIAGLSGAFNSTDSDLDVDPTELSGGQNIIPASETSIKKRGGITLHRNFIGTATGILGGFNFVNKAGTQVNMAVYDTGLYYDDNTNWTAISGITFTTNKQADGAYFPAQDKFYIINQTDNVAKITSTASVNQADSSFKKGKYIIHFQNRLLVANVATQENYVWYTDLGVDTFSANNYFQVEGAITGLVEYYDKVLIFTKRKIYRLQNFTFNGTAAGPEAVITLPVDFGAIYDRTITVVNGFVYFLGQDTTNKASMYKCDGYKAIPVSDRKIKETMQGLSTAQLESACAVADNNNFRVHTAESGDTTNTIGLVYDTVHGKFYTPEKRFVEGRSDFSCLWTSETSGEWIVYAGTQGTGQVYRLHANDGLYDELPEERYLTSGSYNVPVDANPAKRAAQSFKMSNYNRTINVPINKVALLLKKNTGTTTDLQVRIETDNNGKPSGTAVDNGTATLSSFTATSYAWKTVTFSTPPEVLGNTTYWLVLQHVTEGTGNSQYHWLGDSCTATYTNGNLATYSGGASSSTDTFNPSASAITGYALEGVNGSFSTIRSSSGNGSGQNNILVSLAPVSPVDTYDELSRGIIKFDTSSLPNDAVVLSAEIQLYPYSKINDLNLSINFTSATTASNATISDSDYAVSNFGSTKFITDVSISSLTLNSYNTFTLNSDGRSHISLTGVTTFGIRTTSDISNSAPTWADNNGSSVAFQGYNNTNKPRLVVTYTTSGGTATWTSDPITDQDFIIYPQSAIDAYGDSVALLPNNGKEYQLQKFQTVFSTVGDYKVEVGFSTGEYTISKNYLVDLAQTGGGTWGGGDIWAGGAVWGGAQTRNYDWTEVQGFVGRTLKQRVRNRNANQQFEFNRSLFIVTPRRGQS